MEVVTSGKTNEIDNCQFTFPIWFYDSPDKLRSAFMLAIIIAGILFGTINFYCTVNP